MTERDINLSNERYSVDADTLNTLRWALREAMERQQKPFWPPATGFAEPTGFKGTLDDLERAAAAVEALAATVTDCARERDEATAARVYAEELRQSLNDQLNAALEERDNARAERDAAVARNIILHAEVEEQRASRVPVADFALRVYDCIDGAKTLADARLAVEKLEGWNGDEGGYHPGLKTTHYVLRCELDRAQAALELPLLFHSGGPWSEAKRARWLEITEGEDASSKQMCDHIRKVLRIDPV